MEALYASRTILFRRFTLLTTTRDVPFPVHRCHQVVQPSRLHHATNSSRPLWLEQIFYDKRTYFEDVKHVEKCFLTGLDKKSDRFVFSFDAAPHHHRIETSFVALREVCRCHSCFTYDAQQRTHNLINANLKETPKQFNFDRSEQLLRITWSDGHESVYSGPWLHATFTPHPLYEKPKQKLWTTAQYKKNFQQFDFHEICSHPAKMLECLTALASYGLVKVTRAPASTGVLDQLSKHMNYIKKTHYGEVFQVENKPTVTNIAYAFGKLTQHIDLPYFDYMPGLQFLHCIRQSTRGGESTFADAFAVAEWLRANNKPVFDSLSQTKMYVYNYTHDVSDAFLMQKVAPFSLNPDGSLKRVVFSNPTYDSYRHLNADEQLQFVEALQTFLKMLEMPEYRLVFKLNQGEIAIFDNIRVTHGREAFDPSEYRFLEGCYMDWDEIYSRIRVIQSAIFRQKLAKHFEHRNLKQ